MSSGKQRNLNQLLDSVQNVHRQNILEFAGGHLNESKLYKQPTSFSYQGWESSKKDDIVMKQKSKIPRPKKGAAERNAMTETLLQFSTGTSGTHVPKRPVKNHVPGEKISRSPDYYDEVQDDKLITELDIGGIMLPQSKNYRSKGWNEQDLSPNDITKPVQTQGDLRSKNLASKTRRQYVPIAVNAVTKTDQYIARKKLESDVVCKTEAFERSVLQGSKAVEHLEDKLKANLEDLEDVGYGPNFNRLQVYVDVFHDLIRESQTFGHVLKAIQEEYSNYVDFLVESHPNQHGTLRHQVDSLTSKGVSKPLELARERKVVSDLEAKGKKLLETNEKLRHEIDAEQKLVLEFEKTKPKKKTSNSYQERDITNFTLEEKIEDLRANILEKLDEMNSLKKKIAAEYVPASVCSQLSGCVKETETEVQRLLKHNEIMTKEIDSLEQDLRECVEYCDGDEEDEERIWRKIDGDENDPGYYSPRSEDEGKWDFYIS